MDSNSSYVGKRPIYAVIGHVESWASAHAIVNALRDSDRIPVSEDDVRDIYPWIPPRPIFRTRIRSMASEREVSGIYIETFIEPHKLNASNVRRNVERVRAAATWATREGARITALGGFTSIVLEGQTSLLAAGTSNAFTTGNTLTAAFICKGMEEACVLRNRELADSTLLVVGSTGDLGSATVRYFSDRVDRLLLCARNKRRLSEQVQVLQDGGTEAKGSTKLMELLPEADAIILVASTGAQPISLTGRKPEAIVCDAGYPKNSVHEIDDHLAKNLFSGGLGQMLGGISYQPDLSDAFYETPVMNVGHGCALEAVVLAMEERFESFSTGRGNISLNSIEEIWSMARRNGIVLAPFHNAKGMWNEESKPEKKMAIV